MWPAIVFGLILIFVSLALIGSHLFARSQHEVGELDEMEQAYRGLQFRRRMKTSVLIGAVGLAVLGGEGVDGPPLEALYWSGVLLVVVWIVILAVADVASTQSYFLAVHQQRIQDETALQAGMERHSRPQNTCPPDSNSPTTS